MMYGRIEWYLLIFPHIHTHTRTHTHIYIYIFIYIYVKESKRTHRFSVTLSFAPKRSSDRLTIYSSIYVSVCLSICVSVGLFVCQSIYLSILSSYRFIPSLSTFLSINISIRQSFCSLSICRYVNLSVYLLIYPSVFVYLYNVTVEWYDCDSFEMLFDDYWSEILLQKTLLNQRERICCLNLNWWNNLNLILTLSNSWDALPSLVNTEMFIITKNRF